MAWTSLNLRVDASRNLATAGRVLERFTQLIGRGVRILEPVADALAAAQQLFDDDTSALDAVLSQALNALELTQGEAGAYALHIPILPNSTPPTSPPVVPVRTLGDLGRLAGLRAPGPDSGGNYSVYHTLAESLYDEKDLNRPSLSADAYTGAVCIVYGGRHYVDTLPTLLGLQKLLGSLVPIPFDGLALPAPQDVKCRTIPVPKDRTPANTARASVATGGSQKGLHVSWRPRVPLQDFATFGTLTRVIVDSWTVYVKVGSPIQATESLDAYARATNAVRRPVSGAAPDVPYSGNSWQVYLAGFEETETYYVSVGYNVTIVDVATGERTEVHSDINTLSGQQRIRMSERRVPTQFTRGTPPDWVSLATPFDVFPAVRQAVGRTVATLRTLQTEQGETLTTLQRAVRQTKAKVDLVEDVLQEATAALAAASDVAATLSGGLYATSIRGKGGDALLLRQLGAELLDPGIPNQPPFKSPGSVAGALVIVVQYETAGDVEAFLQPIERILRGQTTPTQDAIEALTPDLRPLPPADTAPPSTTQLDALGVDDDPC